MRPSRQRLLKAAGFVCCLPLILGSPDVIAADLARLKTQDARQELYDKYFQELTTLANKCDELQLRDEARKTREHLPVRDPNRSYCFLPLDFVGTNADAPPGNNPDADLKAKWLRKFDSLRQSQAEALFLLAKKSVPQAPDLAYQLLHEVLYENPLHDEARRVLGHKRVARGWDVPARKVRAQPATLVHPDFGWRRGSYWRIESDHFRVTTNHSAREGIKLAEQLEELYSVWKQLFFNYWSTADALTAKFNNRDESFGRKPVFNVVLFRNRDEYVQQLSKVEPKIAMSLGYYLEQRRTAYFYWGPDAAAETWVHEVIHQLFQEADRPVTDVGTEGHVWVVEGIAQYMESFQRHGSFATVGGIDADRLQFARARTLTGEFAMPLQELVKFDRQRLQDEPRIRSIYSHAAGLCHFFMDVERGQLRTSFVRYIQALYGKEKLDSLLTDATGRSYDELDTAFHDFLRVSDADLSPFSVLPLRRNLFLGRTRASDEGLQHIASAKSLEWLDLSFLKVTDQGFSPFANATQLRQLSLEGTNITDATLAQIGELSRLEELDLSGTAITDDGLRGLQRLKRMKVLWLTNTAISDQGLKFVTGWSQLEKLELTGTRVTPEGRRMLREKLPKLEVE